MLWLTGEVSPPPPPAIGLWAMSLDFSPSHRVRAVYQIAGRAGRGGA